MKNSRWPDYDFSPGTIIGGGKTLVVISFHPNSPTNVTRVAAFRAHYGIDAGVALVGGFQNKLSNGSDCVQLQRPDTPPPDDPSFVPYLHEDGVVYEDLPSRLTEAVLHCIVYGLMVWAVTW